MTAQNIPNQVKLRNPGIPMCELATDAELIQEQEQREKFYKLTDHLWAQVAISRENDAIYTWSPDIKDRSEIPDPWEVE